jgi:hypothetical protein
MEKKAINLNIVHENELIGRLFYNKRKLRDA